MTPIMRTESICATAQPAEDNGDAAGEMTTPLRVNGSQYVSGRREQLPDYLRDLPAAGRVDGGFHVAACKKGVFTSQ